VNANSGGTGHPPAANAKAPSSPHENVNSGHQNKENDWRRIAPRSETEFGIENGESGERVEESKSLYYMSLDHLPLAILKQYEKIIQETEQSMDNQQEPQPTQQVRNNCQGSMGLVESGMVVMLGAERQGPTVKEALHRPLKVANNPNKPHHHHHHQEMILLSGQKYSDSERDDESPSRSSSPILSPKSHPTQSCRAMWKGEERGWEKGGEMSRKSTATSTRPTNPKNLSQGTPQHSRSPLFTLSHFGFHHRLLHCSPN